MRTDLQLKKLGIIELGEQIIISDPCYDPGTWCSAKISILPGKYHTFCQLSDEGKWGTRVASIAAVHENYLTLFAENNLTEENLEASLGVDSGQLGIFDAGLPLGQGEYGELDSFYGKCCSLTCGKQQGGTVDGRGVVTSSGYGDGAYLGIQYKTSKEGEVVAISVTFLEQENEE